MAQYAISFDTVGMEDIAAVGGKNASLGVLTRDLADHGIRVPIGFALTTSAYEAFLVHNRLEPVLHRQIERYRGGKISLERAGLTIRCGPACKRDPVSGVIGV